jgi:hypothetical protein
VELVDAKRGKRAAPAQREELRHARRGVVKRDYTRAAGASDRAPVDIAPARGIRSKPHERRTHRRARNDGIALAAAGDVAAAIAKLRASIELAGPDQVDPRTLKALWQLAVRARDWRTAIAAGMLAATRDAGDHRFVQDVLLSLARCPAAELIPPTGPRWLALPASPPSLSVVIVSADDRRFAAVDAEYERTFAGWPHERIRVADARSMYDGYARAFARSRGEIVVFSHDDLRFAVPDFAARLADAMRELDMVGAAGTTRVTAPSLLGSGHPHLFGTITHAMEGAGEYEFSVLSLQGPRIGGAQGLDGVFIAARRELVERLGFDAARFDGFHFYDVDFSYRAHLAGVRVGIAADLGLIHHSRGAADARWHAAQRAFAAKFSLAADSPPAPAHWYAVRLADAAAVSEMYAKLFAAWTLPLGVSV